MLPDSGFISVPHNLASSAEVGLVQQRLGQATASASLADVTLFANSPAHVRVQVVSQPRLRVTAPGPGSHAVVDYTAPVLTVHLPNGTSRSLDSPAHEVEFAVPGGASSRPEAGAAGAAVPAAPATAPGTAGNPAGTAGDLLRLVLADTPAPAPATEHRAPAGPAVVVRLSVGAVHKHVTAEGVSAQAVSLRIKVLTRATGNSGGNGGGYGGGESGGGGYGGGYGGGTGAETTVAEVSVGVLSAQASTQPAGATAESGGTPSTAGTPATAATPAAHTGSLPRTGGSVAAVVAGGTVLLVAGRFLLLLARRRSPVQ